MMKCEEGPGRREEEEEEEAGGSFDVSMVLFLELQRTIEISIPKLSCVVC